MLRLIGSHVRRFRSDLAWTTAELAQRAGVDEALIDEIEERRVDFDIDLLAELADALNTEAYVLVAPPAPADH